MKKRMRSQADKDAAHTIDKQAMRARQRVAFRRNALVAAVSESTPPRDEEAIRAQNREDIEAHKAFGVWPDFERSAPPMFVVGGDS